MNRLLLHGARHHDRGCVFLEREGSSWAETPDWRADRHAIRAGLALREKLGVQAGDVVALRLPLGVRLALAERAVWGLGGVTLVIDPEAGERVRAGAVENAGPVAVVDDDGALDVDSLIAEGGVLDTPERAASFRRGARDVPGSAPASLEPRLDEHGRVRLVERAQADWVAALTALSREHAPSRAVRAILTRRPRFGARVLVHAGWADGVTRTAFASAGVPREAVDSLEPSLILDDETVGSLVPASATLARVDV